MTSIEQQWSAFSIIDAEAVKLRQLRTGSLNELFCTIDTTRFTSGACNIVVALSFSDGLQWVARIQLPLIDENDDSESVETSLLSEVATMQLIRAKSTIPIPSVFGYDASPKNIGYRYILMEALPGHALTSRMAVSIPDEYKEEFAARLAGHLFDLSTISFGQIGRLGNSLDELGQHIMLPFSVPGSSKEIPSQHTYSILRDHAGDNEWEAAARLLGSSVAAMFTEQNINGLFPLCHVDFHYNNVLVDDECNITGLVGWSNAQTVPLERFAIIPEFVAPPAAPIASKQAIASFRQTFVRALAKVQVEREGLQSPEQGTLSHLFASPRSELVV
ncbi:hypothetical protein N7478_008732 [Penicillium angulare]|uniref:uncharacterized protein n=1 Tax=Penicillium angulare TaxID=116970 RepID=UPI00254145D1|nr:uncharacterized protein N7478_008732 [Penicillium angulare]KAJ5273607.1 hypothetical protein N7478_008732 [Penicillium angulare]